MQEDEEKEIINGYEVDSSVWVGNKRIIFAIHPDEKEECRYLKCIASQQDIFTRYENIVISNDYFNIMKQFADDISAETIVLENEERAIGMDDVSCLKVADLTPVSGSDSIKNRVVAIGEKHLVDGYKNISHQLYYVNSGFGVEPNSRGRACYGWNLYSGKKVRIERPYVIGIVPEDKMPDFAKKTLEKIKSEIKREDMDAR